MRIAVLSDIHGNVAALEAVASDIAERSVDVVFNLGDNLSGPLWPKETADFLKRRRDWVHLAGNHERQILTLCPGRGGPSDEFAYGELEADDLAWIQSLEPSLRFGDDVFLCHGTPRCDKEYLLETVDGAGIRPATVREIEERLRGVGAKLVLCGHTHLSRVVRLPAGQTIVNPGSVGLPAYEDDEPLPHLVETGSPHARYAILDDGAGEWSVELVALPYDFEAAARLAASRKREDWARALRFGRA